jgi:hypothetical protein
MPTTEMTDLVEHWISAARAEEVTSVAHRGLRAAEAMLTFGFPDNLVGASPQLISGFVVGLLGIYRERGRCEGRFYAWFDEMAFQLRCCAIEGGESELPFTRPVRIVAEPDRVAEHVMRALRRSVMSFDELVADMSQDDDDELPVFVGTLHP